MDEALLPFVAISIFFLFLRMRRLFGRHRVYGRRLLFRITLLTLFAWALVVPLSGSAQFRLLGVVLGAVLASVGVLITKMKRSGRRIYYWPNPYLGLVIVALLVGRLVQRLVVVGDLAAIVQGNAPLAGITADPWSRGLALAVLTYFAVYYLGILTRSRFMARREAK